MYPDSTHVLFLFCMCVWYIYMDVPVCRYTRVWVHMHVCKQRSEVDVRYLLYSLFYKLSQGLSFELTNIASSASQLALTILSPLPVC